MMLSGNRVMGMFVYGRKTYGEKTGRARRRLGGDL